MRLDVQYSYDGAHYSAIIEATQDGMVEIVQYDDDSLDPWSWDVEVPLSALAQFVDKIREHDESARATDQRDQDDTAASS